MARISEYQRKSAADKEASSRDAMREPAIACQYCETKTTVDDLLRHVRERCPGRRAPHPRSRWITWRAALELGAGKSSLHGWVARGYVQTVGEAGNRRYLMRDVVKMIASVLGARPSSKQPHTTKAPKGRGRGGRPWLERRRR